MKKNTVRAAIIVCLTVMIIAAFASCLSRKNNIETAETKEKETDRTTATITDTEPDTETKITSAYPTTEPVIIPDTTAATEKQTETAKPIETTKTPETVKPVEAHTHSYTVKVTAPTCTEGGFTTHTCSCGDSYIDSKTAALGHTWDSGVITKAATETSEGVMTYTCTRCKITRTEVIPKEAAFMQLRIMTQNVRTDRASDSAENNYLLRFERFKTLVSDYRPDVICCQEVTENWMRLLEKMTDYGIYYQYRCTEGSIESVPVMYSKNRFDLLDQGYFWLSETPDEMSLGWDEQYYRIINWVKLSDKETGITFICASCHFPLGETAKVNAAAVFTEQMKEIAGGLPVIAAGDFNDNEDSVMYANLTSDGYFTDCRMISEKIGNNGCTYMKYGKKMNALPIDFFFTTAGIGVEYYSVITDMPDGQYVSDHFGVYTDLVIPRVQ